MQGEFEKSVQEKMAELRLPPTAPVWENIAQQIKPEKKRRRVIFWFFFAGLMAGGSWWLLWQPEPRNSQAMESDRPAAAVQNTTASSVAKGAGATEKSIAPETHTGPVAHDWLLGDKGNPRTAQKLAEHGFTALVKTKRQKPASTAVSPLGNSFPPPAEDASSAVNAETKTVENTSVATRAEAEDLKAVSPKKADSSKAILPVTSEGTIPVAADSNSRKPKVASLEKKWQKQLLLSAGWSQYSSGITTAFQDRYASSSPVANNGGSYIGSSQPVRYTKGFAFSVGAGLSRSLTDRLSLTAALQYSYLSVNSKVGNYRRIDTAIAYLGDRVSVGGYYDKSQVRDYKTSFHVLELPFGVEYRLFRGIPLQLSAGVAYGRLLNSNALTYDAATNFYYYNKDNNTVSYINFFAGLQYRLLKKTGWKLEAGPQVKYNTSRLQKQAVGEQPHLFSAGLKTVVSF